MKGVPRMRSISTGSLLGMVTGLVLGIFSQDYPSLLALAPFARLFAKGWITVVIIMALPLVACQLVTGLSAMFKTSLIGKVVLRGLGAHVVMLVLGSVLSVTFGYFFTNRVALDFPAILSSTSSVSSDPGDVVNGWLATVQGLAMQLIVPVILGVTVLTFALTKTPEHLSHWVTAFSGRVSERIFNALRILFILLPVSAGSIAFLIAGQSGLQLAGFAGTYLLGVCMVLVTMTGLIYLLFRFFGPIPVRHFSRCMFPAQVVAAGTCSSLATLPALLESTGSFSRNMPINRLVVPLFVSFFRLNLLVANPFSFFILSAAYNLPVESHNLLLFIGLMIITSFGSPGLPQMGKVYSMPVFLAAGIPLEGVLILKAVDGIPDIFKTVLNVTEIGALVSLVSSQAGHPEEITQPS